MRRIEERRGGGRRRRRRIVLDRCRLDGLASGEGREVDEGGDEKMRMKKKRVVVVVGVSFEERARTRGGRQGGRG